jgi:hypothetical protein
MPVIGPLTSLQQLGSTDTLIHAVDVELDSNHLCSFTEGH